MGNRVRPEPNKQVETLASATRGDSAPGDECPTQHTRHKKRPDPGKPARDHAGTPIGERMAGAQPIMHTTSHSPSREQEKQAGNQTDGLKGKGNVLPTPDTTTHQSMSQTGREGCRCLYG